MAGLVLVVSGLGVVAAVVLVLMLLAGKPEDRENVNTVIVLGSGD